MPDAQELIAKAPCGPIPEKGQRVRCQLVTGREVEGLVTKVFEDHSVGFVVQTGLLGPEVVIPAMGDRWHQEPAVTVAGD